MQAPTIYPGQLLGGDPMYQGFTLGETVVFVADGNFVKSEYPGLRAINLRSQIILAKDLPDSYPITATGRAYATGVYAHDSDLGSRTFTNAGYLDMDALTGGAGTLTAVAATLTTGTMALITMSAFQSVSGSGEGWVSYKVEGATTIAASDTWSLHQKLPANNGISATRTRIHTGLTPGLNTFELQTKVTGGTGTISNLDLAITSLAPGMPVGLLY